MGSWSSEAHLWRQVVAILFYIYIPTGQYHGNFKFPSILSFKLKLFVV